VNRQRGTDAPDHNAIGELRRNRPGPNSVPTLTPATKINTSMGVSARAWRAVRV
jgi:hypothetical protein